MQVPIHTIMIPVPTPQAPAGLVPFGALDMAGNVWEWVADYYSVDYYATSPEHNPPGPKTSGTNRRVLRGGSFQDG